MFLHFSAPDQIGKNAVLQQVLPIHSLSTLELSDDAVAILRKLRHVGVLAAGDFSNNGLIAGVQRAKDGAVWFFKETAEKRGRMGASVRGR